MRRLLALALGLALPAPALAWELGAPYARVGLEAGYDDTVGGLSGADPQRLLGAADASGMLSLGGGLELLLDPTWSVTLAGSLKGTRYAHDVSYSGYWGSLATELAAYSLVGELDAFWGVSMGTGARGRSGGTSLALEHPLPFDLKGTTSLGAYRYWGEGTTLTGLWGEGAVRRRFGPLSLTCAYSYGQRGYLDGTSAGVHALSANASWRLLEGAYLKALVERSWDSSRATPGTYATVGASYYFF